MSNPLQASGKSCHSRKTALLTSTSGGGLTSTSGGGLTSTSGGVPLAAHLAAALHDPAAHGEGHHDPPQDEQHEGEGEAGVVAEVGGGRAARVPGPVRVGAEYHH